MDQKRLYVYEVWDAPTRWFHWINVLAVLALMAFGLVIYNGDALGLSSDGKVLLKTLHVWVGYVFLANLLWRVLWAFIGNRYARWRAILPRGPGYFGALFGYLGSLLSGRPHAYVGHNPVGRLAITLFLVVLVLQGFSGLVLAGTDLYYPPFGVWFAEWVAAPGVAPAELAPYRPDLVDQAAYADMRTFREPFIATHELGVYVIAGLVVIHVFAVVVTEVWEGGTLTSALFTGRKIFTRPARDDDRPPIEGD
jgi:Ni/Fe-hydrogenase 1 B-type cytochrome subunit